MKCGSCEKRNKRCFFDPTVRAPGNARTCHQCHHRKVKCYANHPGLEDRPAVQRPPKVLYSFLDVPLGASAERLRMIKMEGTPQPGVAGEEDIVDLQDTGDLFTHVVELIRELRDDNRKLQDDVMRLSTELVTFEIRTDQDLRMIAAGVASLKSNLDECTLSGYTVNANARSATADPSSRPTWRWPVPSATRASSRIPAECRRADRDTSPAGEHGRASRKHQGRRRRRHHPAEPSAPRRAHRTACRAPLRTPIVGEPVGEQLVRDPTPSKNDSNAVDPATLGPLESDAKPPAETPRDPQASHDH